MSSPTEIAKVDANSSAPTTETLRFVCVHGHFYQPPRENPWLETVGVQSSASPFHDWNERITAECYAPNGASRITNQQGQIVRILNNYAQISYNFGPTLLSWLQEHAPRTYAAILAADKQSAERFGGHGSAMAQVYNHIIMPLASTRDAKTQIRWGIADFKHRFGRMPEGMWLAETAVSRAVLDLMAQEGIKFTVLAPNQCARVRPVPAGQGSDNGTAENAGANAAHEATHRWRDTPNASVDPTQPYRIKLDEGRSIAVFFYDGPTSRAIAFEGLLNSGENFGKRILSSLGAGHGDHGSAPRAQLAHVATDGESYGHHHRHGEMALSYALQWIEEKRLAKITNYGEFLAAFPPSWEAEIVEASSWSCFHGVERWRSDCGCNGGKPGWNQAWRGPLRAALDFLRDRTAPLALDFAEPLLMDFWAARDAYISLILDRGRANVDRFFEQHGKRLLTQQERVHLLELFELERHTQLMYTSCGWFFDEISGIETVQIIAYAGRVLQLAAKLFGNDGEALEGEFLGLLARAKSNLSEVGDGAEIYRRSVQSARIDLEHAGAHYAISSMFRSYPASGSIFCFDVQRQAYDVLTSGRGKVGIGRARLRSRITEQTEDVGFAVLHLGDQNLSAAVKCFPDMDEAAWNKFNDQARSALRRSNLPELIHLIEDLFGSNTFSLASLFADEQQQILKRILKQTLTDLEDSLIRIYEEHATLLHYLRDSNVPAPSALELTAGFAINASLRRALEAEHFNPAELSRLLRRAEMDHVELDIPMLNYTADGLMKRAMLALEAAVKSQQMSVLVETVAIAESLRTLPGPSNLWHAQNIWDQMRRSPGSTGWHREWWESFRKLGSALRIAVEEIDHNAEYLGN